MLKLLRKNFNCSKNNQDIWKMGYSKKIDGGQIKSMEQSISSKGFLRSHKPYTPPKNVHDKIKFICSSMNLPVQLDYKFTTLEEKFEFFNKCFVNFAHGVPNSQLHELQYIGDVIKFYETPVNTTVPFDAFKNMKLPENLHIQYEYLRFNPDTDTKFKGQTAFPKSSTLVTGLKYREKYKGYEAKRSWP